LIAVEAAANAVCRVATASLRALAYNLGNFHNTGDAGRERSLAAKESDDGPKIVSSGRYAHPRWPEVAIETSSPTSCDCRGTATAARGRKGNLRERCRNDRHSEQAPTRLHALDERRRINEAFIWRFGCSKKMTAGMS
jgi:hypothetical protein